MKQAALWIALALSVGLNLGWIARSVLAPPVRLPEEIDTLSINLDEFSDLTSIADGDPSEESVGETPSAEGGTGPAPEPAPDGSSLTSPVTTPPGATLPSVVPDTRQDPEPSTPAATPENPRSDPSDAKGGPSTGLRGLPAISTLADRLRLEGARRDHFIRSQHQLFETTQSQLRAIRTLQAELRRELMAPRPDRVRVQRITEKLGESYAALDEAFAQSVLEARKILGPVQERQYLRFLRALRQRAMERVRR